MNRRNLFKMLFGGTVAAVVLKELPAEAAPPFEWTEYPPVGRHMCFQNFMSPDLRDLEAYAKYVAPPEFISVQSEEWTDIHKMNANNTALIELLEARLEAYRI